MAYYRAAARFFAWCDQHHIGEIADIEPLRVAACDFASNRAPAIDRAELPDLN